MIINLIKKNSEKIINSPNSFSPFGLILYFLTFLSKIYEIMMRIRAKYKTKISPNQINAIIISIGNITCGGTGKTPLVCWLANYLALREKKIGIIIRGYARKKNINKPIVVGEDFIDANQIDYFGDEALLLAANCPHAKIAVSANRLRAIKVLEQKYQCDVIILDDGFQQIHIPKHMDIICLDPQKPFGNRFLLPRGNLREPLKALNRGSHYMFCKGKPRKIIQNKLLKYITNKEQFIYYCEFNIFGAYLLNEPLKVVELEQFKNKPLLLLCGIGNPESFVQSLYRLDIEGECKSYPDHYQYSIDDVNNINTIVMQKDYYAILTTEKDAVRLKKMVFNKPCYVVETTLNPTLEFQEEIDKLLKRSKNSL